MKELGGAILPRTAQRLTAVSDGGLCVKKTHLAHIFSDIVAYSRVLTKLEKCNVSSPVGRWEGKMCKLDLGVAGSLRNDLAEV